MNATTVDPRLPLRQRIAVIVAILALLASVVCLRMAVQARARERSAHLAGAPYLSRISLAGPSPTVQMNRSSYSVSAIVGGFAIPS
jgi:hypothetical protein